MNDLSTFMDAVLDTIQGVEKRWAAKLQAAEEKADTTRREYDARIADMRVEMATLKAEVVVSKSAQMDALSVAVKGMSVGREVDIQGLVESEVQNAFAALPTPRDGEPGKSIEPEDVDAMVAAHVSKAFSDLTLPRDGKDVTVDDVAPLIQSEVAKAVAEIPKPEKGEPGADGKSIDPAIVDVMVKAMVEREVAAIPRPQDGTSVTLDDVKPWLLEELSKAVSALPQAKDGVGLTGALIDSDGQLVITLSDGTLKTLKRVVGEPGQKGDQGERGHDGKDGRDGTLEHLKMEQVSERIVRFLREDGSVVGELKLDHPVFRDTYVEGKAYDKGDLVQWDGSGWIALKDTPPLKPGTAPPELSGWKLWIKKGAEGKVGKAGPVGPVGPRGEMGPQGRSGY